MKGVLALSTAEISLEGEIPQPSNIVNMTFLPILIVFSAKIRIIDR
jgi:hypothetical protein